MTGDGAHHVYQRNVVHDPLSERKYRYLNLNQNLCNETQPYLCQRQLRLWAADFKMRTKTKHLAVWG